jgi:hypothetical protein
VQPARVAVGAATVVSLASVWHSGGHVWRRIETDHRTFSSLTERQRVQAPATGVQLDGNIFDWYAHFLAKGDRFYVQVDAEHIPRVVRMLASYYLLPAAEVDDPSRATVVISYQADPSTLGVHYLTQAQAGAQPLFVSRIRPP